MTEVIYAGSVRWVDAVAVTTVTGTLVATSAILVAIRLLPLDLADRNRVRVPGSSPMYSKARSF